MICHILLIPLPLSLSVLATAYLSKSQLGRVSISITNPTNFPKRQNTYLRRCYLCFSFFFELAPSHNFTHQLEIIFHDLL